MITPILSLPQFNQSTTSALGAYNLNRTTGWLVGRGGVESFSGYIDNRFQGLLSDQGSVDSFGSYGLQQDLPSPLRGVGANNAGARSRIITMGDDSGADSGDGSSDSSGSSLWDSAGSFFEKAFGGAVKTGLTVLENTAQQKIREMAGYSDTGKTVGLKDGRAARILQSPQGTLVALFADGSTTPYLPSMAATAPQTNSQILSSGTTIGIGVGLAVAAVVVVLLMRKK